MVKGLKGNVNVFIIHREKDVSLLQKIVCQYNGRTFGNTTLNIRFVGSNQSAHLGMDFGDIIKSLINDAECVLVLITENTEESLWVNQEIGYTIGKGKPLIPVKKYSMANRGCGFMHSNIHSQLFKPDQSRFPILDQFFEARFNKMARKVVGASMIVEPVEENKRVYSRKADPSVVS